MKKQNNILGFGYHGNIELNPLCIIFVAGTGRVLVCLHLPADLCHTRFNISLDNLWLSVPVPRGPPGGVLLLGHRSLLLLPAVLLSWSEAGETLPPHQGGSVVSQGGESQV